VWIAPLEDQLVFMTNDNVGKTKRLAHTTRVELQECDVRGRVKEGAPVVTGAAVVVRDEAGQARARAAITRKYGLLARGFEVANLVGKIIPRLKPAPRAAIYVTLD
jgi:PPOX class probable F420-dependent enzyme